MRKRVDIEGFYKLLVDFVELSPGVSLFEILEKFFKGVCPRSIVNMEDMDLVVLESFCSEYGSLPFDGGTMDQPNLVIECFNAIRAGKNDFEEKRNKEFKQSIKKQQAKQSSGGQNVRGAGR